MAKELGDAFRSGGGQLTIGKPSDGTGSAGDFVTLNGSGQVTPTAAAGDDIYGVLAQDAPAAGEDVPVHILGPVVANVAGGVTDNDVLVGSGTAGQAAANSVGTYQSVDEGGTATYNLALDAPRALSDAGGTLDGESLGTNEAGVLLK